MENWIRKKYLGSLFRSHGEISQILVSQESNIQKLYKFTLTVVHEIKAV